MPARAALHQEDLARLEAHPLEHIGPDGREGLGQAARIDQADAGRHRQALHRRGGSKFAVAVADHQRANLVADLPFGNALAGLHDCSRAFETGDVGGAGRHRIAAHPLQAIGSVDPGGGDPDQHLPSLRFRHRPGRRHQHLRPAGRFDLDDGLSGGNVGEHGRPLGNGVGGDYKGAGPVVAALGVQVWAVRPSCVDTARAARSSCGARRSSAAVGQP